MSDRASINPLHITEADEEPYITVPNDGTTFADAEVRRLTTILNNTGCRMKMGPCQRVVGPDKAEQRRAITPDKIPRSPAQPSLSERRESQANPVADAMKSAEISADVRLKLDKESWKLCLNNLRQNE